MFLVEVAAALDMSVFVFGRAVKYALECLRMEAPPPAPGVYVRRVACGLSALARPALRARPPPTSDPPPAPVGLSEGGSCLRLDALCVDGHQASSSARSLGWSCLQRT